MASVTVFNMEGAEVGTMELSDKLFGVEINEHLVHQAVVQQLADNRQGTQKAKTRSEVSHSTIKPWRQKGTGHARQGSTRAPQWRHGGVVFAPVPRDYSFKLNKKLKALARFSALTYKAQENRIILVEPFAMEAPKTKEFLQILSAIQAGDRKVLFVLPENSANIYLSSRNLENVKVISVNEINTYAIMNAHSLVLVDGVQDILSSRVSR